jgi:hypothetical protein
MAGRVVAEGMSVRNVEEAVQLARSDAAVPAPKPRGGRSKAAPRAELTELADRLSDRFETRVKVDMGRLAQGDDRLRVGRGPAPHRRAAGAPDSDGSRQD